MIIGIPTASETRTVTIRVRDSSLATATTAAFTINTGWMVSTYGGTGSSIMSGNGGAATSAGMQPATLSIARDGSIYFVEDTANLIRKIASNGVISQILTSVGRSMTLLARDNGDFYYAPWIASTKLKKYTASTATTADWSTGAVNLNYPRGMVMDSSGNFFVADGGAHIIRKFAPDGTPSVVAGTGTASSTGDGGQATSATLNSPMDLALDSVGNLYVTEYNGNRIRKIATNGVISTVIGNGTSVMSGDGGLAVNATVNNLWSIAIDGGDNIYFNEGMLGTIRKIDATTGIVTRVVGIGEPGVMGSPINGVSSIATFSLVTLQMRFDVLGNLYWVDKYNYMIRKVALLGVPIKNASAVSVTAGGSFTKGQNQTLTTTVNTGGKLTFLANGKRIPGCFSRILAAAGSFICNWKPTASGSVRLSTSFIPDDITYNRSEQILDVVVGRRSNKR